MGMALSFTGFVTDWGWPSVVAMEKCLFLEEWWKGKRRNKYRMNCIV